MDINPCFQFFQHRFHLGEELDLLVPDQFKVGFLNTSVSGKVDLVRRWWAGDVILDIISTYHIHFWALPNIQRKKISSWDKDHWLTYILKWLLSRFDAKLSLLDKAIVGKARIKNPYCGLTILIVPVWRREFWLPGIICSHALEA